MQTFAAEAPRQVDVAAMISWKIEMEEISAAGQKFRSCICAQAKFPSIHSV